jgi:hypothetical protein
MTLLEYIKLDDNKKNDLIIESGILLDVYSEKNKCIHFFSLFNFFVEVISDEKKKTILDIIPYESNFRFGVMQKEKKAAQDSIVKTLNYYFLL